MNKEELRRLIGEVQDANILEALWELYELKFCAMSTSTYPFVTTTNYPSLINKTNTDPFKMTYDTINECRLSN